MARAHVREHDARRAGQRAARRERARGVPVVLERARRNEHPGPRSVGRLVPALRVRACPMSAMGSETRGNLARARGARTTPKPPTRSSGFWRRNSSGSRGASLSASCHSHEATGVGEPMYINQRHMAVPERGSAATAANAAR